jgi:hypothetical protein
VARLGKADVEALLAAYDADPVGALTAALRLVLEQPSWSWDDLVAALPPSRRAGLLAQDPDALDALAAELNELRTVAAAPRTPLQRSVGSRPCPS